MIPTGTSRRLILVSLFSCWQCSNCVAVYRLSPAFRFLAPMQVLRSIESLQLECPVVLPCPDSESCAGPCGFEAVHSAWSV